MAKRSEQVLMTYLSIAVNILVSGIAVEPKSFRMSRMPIYYGKRSANNILDNRIQVSERFNDNVKMDASYLHSSADRWISSFNGKGDRLMISSDDESPMTEHRTRFNHKPLYLDDNTNNVYNENWKHSMLSTTPGYSGRLSDLNFSGLRNSEDNGKITFVLHRMSEASENRPDLRPDFKFTTAEHNYKLFKRNSLRRMPTFYGKRSQGFDDFHKEGVAESQSKDISQTQGIAELQKQGIDDSQLQGIDDAQSYDISESNLQGSSKSHLHDRRNIKSALNTFLNDKYLSYTNRYLSGLHLPENTNRYLSGTHLPGSTAQNNLVHTFMHLIDTARQSKKMTEYESAESFGSPGMATLYNTLSADHIYQKNTNNKYSTADVVNNNNLDIILNRREKTVKFLRKRHFSSPLDRMPQFFGKRDNISI